MLLVSQSPTDRFTGGARVLLGLESLPDARRKGILVPICPAYSHAPLEPVVAVTEGHICPRATSTSHPLMRLGGYSPASCPAMPSSTCPQPSAVIPTHRAHVRLLSRRASASLQVPVSCGLSVTTSGHPHRWPRLKTVPFTRSTYKSAQRIRVQAPQCQSRMCSVAQ